MPSAGSAKYWDNKKTVSGRADGLSDIRRKILRDEAARGRWCKSRHLLDIAQIALGRLERTHLSIADRIAENAGSRGALSLRSSICLVTTSADDVYFCHDQVIADRHFHVLYEKDLCGFQEPFIVTGLAYYPSADYSAAQSKNLSSETSDENQRCGYPSGQYIGI